MLENQKLELCDKCNVLADFCPDFGFYSCSKCGDAWAYDEDDPDYFELTTALCPFHDKGSCTNNMPTYPKCNDCPNKNLNQKAITF